MKVYRNVDVKLASLLLTLGKEKSVLLPPYLK
jgi:hypothetical protein